MSSKQQQIILPKTETAFLTGDIRGDNLFEFMRKVAGNLLTGVYTSAFLNQNFPASKNIGKLAYTTDQQWMVSNGAAWNPVGGGVGVSLSSVSEVLANGASDLGSSPPPGYVAGTTNRLLLTANAAGSTVNGLLSAPDGWSITVQNPSSVGSITFPHQSASLAANQFTCPGGVAAVLGPFAAATLDYIAGTGWVFT